MQRQSQLSTISKVNDLRSRFNITIFFISSIMKCSDLNNINTDDLLDWFSHFSNNFKVESWYFLRTYSVLQIVQIENHDFCRNHFMASTYQTSRGAISRFLWGRTLNFTSRGWFFLILKTFISHLWKEGGKFSMFFTFYKICWQVFAHIFNFPQKFINSCFENVKFILLELPGLGIRALKNSKVSHFLYS